MHRQEVRKGRESLILELVKSIRKTHPRMGGRKLWVKIAEELKQHKLKMPGRDGFYAILRANELLLERRKSQCPHTTYSGHNYAVQPNLLKNLEVVRPLQALVSDVTYLRVGHGFAYLFLTTEVDTRNIVGYYLAKNLEHNGAIEALKMAIKKLPSISGAIFHSDRGVQYCCHEFLDELQRCGLRSSMTGAS